MRRRALMALAALAAAAVLATSALPTLRGLAFVVRAADVQGPARRLAAVGTRTFDERLETISVRGAPLRIRRYTPSGRSRRTALLVSGLHPAGIDEPRLVGLARELARSGLTVVTPDIPELSRFQITPAITDRIADAADALAGAGRIALMGISFSGGLAVVAAGRPALRNHVAYVFSFGGHDDLPRVLRYLCTGVEPSPSPGAPPLVRPPHDYGVAVILLGVADRLVPPGQVAPLRQAVRRYLWASHLDRVDKPRAAREFQALRALAARLPEPSATLLDEVTRRDVVHLGARLLPWVGAYGNDPALSPSKSPPPAAPVWLLHGDDDNVIPPLESEYLAAQLAGHVPVRLLLSDLISHAEADRPMHLFDVLRLARFWGDMLRE